MEETVTGIINNPSNIYDATLYKKGSAELIYGDTYQKGSAIQSRKAGEIIFDSGIIPAGTFEGTYNIHFYYSSSSATVQGTPLMRFEIYENGVLMPEDTTVYGANTIYEYDLNYINGGLIYGIFDAKVLKANCNYQLIIKTSDQLAVDAILDYVSFSRVTDGAIINAIPFNKIVGTRNAGATNTLDELGTQQEIEIAAGTLTGTIAAGDTTTVTLTYITPFKRINIAIPSISNGNGQILCNYGSRDATASTITLKIRNVSTSSWTGSNTSNLAIVIIGYI